MLKKFIFSCLIILAGIDAYAKFTAFERMNDLFFDEGYIEFEYNFMALNPSRDLLILKISSGSTSSTK